MRVYVCSIQLKNLSDLLCPIRCYLQCMIHTYDVHNFIRRSLFLDLFGLRKLSSAAIHIAISATYFSRRHLNHYTHNSVAVIV